MLRGIAANSWVRGALGAVLLLAPVGCGRQARVVVYCAQDKEFAEGAFANFQKHTGVAVAPHFDTETTKSVSLYEELVPEADRPRCDVFWNNEILSTIRLRRQGLLEPYASPAAAPYPAWCRGPDDTYHAFAARARVLIVSAKVPEAERPRSLLDLTDPPPTIASAVPSSPRTARSSGSSCPTTSSRWSATIGRTASRWSRSAFVPVPDFTGSRKRHPSPGHRHGHG